MSVGSWASVLHQLEPLGTICLLKLSVLKTSNRDARLGSSPGSLPASGFYSCCWTPSVTCPLRSSLTSLGDAVSLFSPPNVDRNVDGSYLVRKLSSFSRKGVGQVVTFGPLSIKRLIVCCLVIVLTILNFWSWRQQLSLNIRILSSMKSPQ